MRRTIPRSRFLMTLIFGAGLAHAGGTLPLEAGNYVAAHYTPCEQAPLAGVTSFDGTSLGGPHDSHCQTAILAQHGPAYRVQVSCTARGDGTPTTPTADVEDVRITSRTSFVRLLGKDEVAYALCPAFH